MVSTCVASPSAAAYSRSPGALAFRARQLSSQPLQRCDNMLNCLWLALILAAVLIGGFDDRVKEVAEGAVKGAESAVTLSFGLVGVMAVWLGMMRLAERAGLVQGLSHLLRPLLRFLFPDVPAEHPAMGSMVLNIAANMLGLVNAATPLGLRAMKDLESLNQNPGTATNAMCTFLAINTGSVQLIPITAIAVLAVAGSTNPSAIIGTALLATACSSAAGLIAVKWLEKWRMFRLSESSANAVTKVGERAPQPEPSELAPGAPPAFGPMEAWRWLVLAVFVACFLWFTLRLGSPDWFNRVPPPDQSGRGALVRWINAVSLLAIPFLLSFFPLYAALRRIPVYEEFVEGAREGFQVAVRIIPYLVAMLVAIGMFRGAGGIDLLTRLLRPVLDAAHFPSELLPMALMRPLSGSGTLALFSDLVKQLGPDNPVVRMAGTLYGSTETTFYVIAVYFGAVGVKRTRHAVPAGLIADAVGVIASVIVCRLVFAGA
jgi:spore maturation protein SpmA